MEKLRNYSLQNLYLPLNIIQRGLQWRDNILVGKPEGKRPLGRLRCRWEGNIRVDLREIVWDGVDWIHLAQNRDKRRALVNMVMNLRVP
jgi:hypothetical protein